MAVLQKGTDVLITLGTFTYTGYIVDSASLKPLADIEEVRDENNHIVTKLYWKQGDQLSLDLIVKDTIDPTTIDIGDQITIDSVIYLVDDADVSYARNQTKLGLTLTVYDNITLT